MPGKPCHIFFPVSSKGGVAVFVNKDQFVEAFCNEREWFVRLACTNYINIVDGIFTGYLVIRLGRCDRSGVGGGAVVHVIR